MALYVVVPLLVLVAVVQASVLSHLTVWGVFADLPVLVVVSWGFLGGAREGTIWGFIAGLAVDMLAGGPFGAATVSLTFIGFAAGLAKGSVLAGRWVFPMALMFLATLLYDLVFLLVMGISGRTVTWMDTLFRVILPSALLNALATPLVLGIMRALYNRFGQRKREW